MSLRYLLDTDVLIDVLRGTPAAINFLSSTSPYKAISSITVAELYAGVREGKETNILEKFLSLFDVLPANTEVTKQGGLYKRDYGKTHGTGLADAIIAATATLSNCTLVTLNKRHFPMVANLLVPYQKETSKS